MKTQFIIIESKLKWKRVGLKLSIGSPRKMTVDIVIQQVGEPRERPPRLDENITLMETHKSGAPSRHSSIPKGLPGQRNSVAANPKTLRQDLSKLIVKKKIDIKAGGLQAEDLIEISKELGIKVSHQQASEAIFFFKGGNPMRHISLLPQVTDDDDRMKSMDSEKKKQMMSPEERMEAIRKNPHFNKLVEWFVLNIPALAQIYELIVRGVDYIIPPNKMNTARTEHRFINRFGFEKALITEHIEIDQGRHEKGDFTDRLQKGRHLTYKRRMNMPEGFKSQVDKYLKDINSLPPLKKSLNSTFTSIGHAIMENKASFGNRGQEKAMRRLKSTHREREELIKNNLNDIILNEPDALHATNLYYLLNKRWIEYPKAYKLNTELTSKQQRRIKDLLNSRKIG